MYVSVKQISQGRDKNVLLQSQEERDKEVPSEHMSINMPSQAGGNRWKQRGNV